MTSLIMISVLLFTNVCFMTFTLGKTNELDPLKTKTDWVSSEIMFGKYFLDVINEIRTVETVETPDGKGPVVLNDIDKSFLLTRCKGDLDCIQSKSISIQKYRIKMEALQCVNAVMMHYMLNIMIKNHKKINSSPINDNNLYVYTNFIIQKMLSLLLISKTRAHNCLWNIFFQVYSKFNWPNNYAPDNNTFDPEYMTQLVDYIVHCQHNHYLSINDDRPTSLQAYYNSIVKMDIRMYIDQLYGFQFNEKLNKFFSFNKLFSIETFALSDYLNRDTDLFGTFVNSNIFWGSCKRLLRNEKDKLRAWYHTFDFVKEPFKYTEYHMRVLLIIKINIYIYIRSHIKMFENPLSQAKNHVEEINFKVADTSIWILPCKPLREFLFFDYEDPVLFSIIDQLCSEVDAFNGEFLEKLRYMTKIAKEIISIDMKKIGVDDNDVDATLHEYDEPQSKENVFQDLIQMGANEDHVRSILYDDHDTLNDTDLPTITSSSGRKDKEPLSFENDAVITNVCDNLDKPNDTQSETQENLSTITSSSGQKDKEPLCSEIEEVVTADVCDNLDTPKDNQSEVQEDLSIVPSNSKREDKERLTLSDTTKSKKTTTIENHNIVIYDNVVATTLAVDNKPESDENVCQDSIQMGANKDYERDPNDRDVTDEWGNLDQQKDTQSDMKEDVSINKPESDENADQDSIQMGANEDHVRDRNDQVIPDLCGNLDTPKDTQSEINEDTSIDPSNSDRKDKELLNMAERTDIEKKVTLKSNKIVERTDAFFKYTNVINSKLRPIHYCFILMFYNGKDKLNVTFFPNTGLQLPSTRE
ncbi:uncharacterized protein LOC126832924 isoform X2 [Adelges cooleyi]|uniref:uncharacterized protein LOC126832924 isoform X2 n=1 Tax=Adelges cooleyi TaxID=133065 RepID=UPI0021802D2F|nr:uncharacterized protein LOC126832924 isoform X2 [Adelges cooleyi]